MDANAGQARTSFSRIVAWVIRAKRDALIEAAGVLDATALAIIFRGAETLLVHVGRILEERSGQA
jgi:hypothetical protein